MSSPLRRPWPASLPVPPATGLLALAQIAGFAVATAVEGAVRVLALVPAGLARRPWSAVSYAFVEQGAPVFLLDLMVLLLVAPRLENRVGSLRLAGYYLAGVALGVVLALFRPTTPIMGAGLALFGLLAGFSRSCRDEPLIPPLRSLGRLGLAALGIAVLLSPLSVVPSVAGRGVLLGALVSGLLALGRSARRTAPRRVEAPNSFFNPPGVTHGPITTPWDSIDLDSLHEVNRSTVEVLLDRARALGPDHLTLGERELLDRMASAARLAAEAASRTTFAS